MTKNEIVEYSCSEEENEIIPAEPIKPVVVADVPAAERSEKTTKKKKNSPPTTKQGSILSFFSKK